MRHVMSSEEGGYEGVTGIWTVRLRAQDEFHSLLFMSFVEQVRERE